MIVWLDAQVPPALAQWLTRRFGVGAVALRDLGLARGADLAVFRAARAAGAVVLTKDADFLRLLERLGPPPQVVWLTCGNTSNEALRSLLERLWPRAHALLAAGEPLVEIRGP